MNKKKIKRFLSSILPNGEIKEVIKLYYYNLITSNKIRFKRNKKNKTFIFKHNKKSIETNTPLYTVYKDFEIYTKLYTPKKDDVILDIGANSGIISLYFASILKNGIVYSIEPDSNNVTNIKNNLNLNPKYKDSIIIDNSLIWNEVSKIKFHEDSSVASSIFYKGENSKTVLKETITLDTWVEKNNLNKLNFIKMDIEGAEVEAIQGAIHIIKKFKPNFAIASYHIIEGQPTYLKLEKLFKKINYPYKTVKINQTEIITYAGPVIETFFNN
ncbi:FkbM family methyltransferase [uncultured Polaribacter sp.]|uniref:FkbM family methyltransferase n=1 Tax=uncultured Polaribacter sp. TaxID=174711 RepID=UPI002615AD11|nr:FkbM family methyltransferase [uncultured Polaribacter sp.]